MGARVTIEPTSPSDAPEPVGTVSVSASDLEGVEVGADEVPSLIDELPLVAVLGCRAKGTTRITGAEELRAKESDRIATTVSNLRSLGVDVEEHRDGLTVRGSDRPLRGSVKACHDHRIAMAFSVLGALDGNEIDVDDPGVADVSFPGFHRALARLTRPIRT
jgi:3-phosphoshikimate 1-carboxyvinyltransferase